MRLLLDTHAFLWFVLGNVQCSSTARSLIEDENNEKWLSPASHWELAIKIGIGKYTLPDPFEVFIERAIDANGFLILPIEPSHTSVLTALPLHHRDPFDRLIIAQAMVEQMDIVGADTQFDAYPITRLW